LFATCARGGAAAATCLAGHVGDDLDVLARAEHRLGEAQLELHLDVVAARRRSGASGGAPGAARVAQHAVEHAAAEEDVEEVLERDVVEVGHRTPAQAVEPVAVVGGAGVLVAQDLVSLGQFLEARLRLRIVGIDIRMTGARLLAKGLLDLGLPHVP